MFSDSLHSVIFIPMSLFMFFSFFVCRFHWCFIVAVLRCRPSVHRTHTVSLCDVEGFVRYNPIQLRLLLICHHNNHIFIDVICFIDVIDDTSPGCLSVQTDSKMQENKSRRFADKMIFSDT